MATKTRRLAAVKPTAAPMFQPRPEWAHPTSEAHQARYIRAVAFLRRGGISRWLMDRDSFAPKWRALPVESVKEQTA